MTAMTAGIIGGGMIAAVHAHALRASGVRVAGVAGGSPKRSEVFAQRLSAERAFATPEDLIAAPGIDVVHICTPNASHAVYARQALEAGKAVICEKPLGVDLDEARELSDYANRHGRLTAVPFVYRFYPMVREMKARVAAPEQSISLIRGSYLQDWLADPKSTNWRVNDVDGGSSRAFADIGVHLCDLIEFTTGQRISRLTANTSTTFSHRQNVQVRTEDIATVMFETDHGVPGTAAVSQVSQGYKNRLKLSIDADAASYRFDQETPDSLLIGSQDSTSIVPRSETSLRNSDARRLSLVPGGHPQGYQDSFNAFMLDAYRSFMGQEVLGLPTFADGLRAAELTDAVLKSAGSGTWEFVAHAAEELKPADGRGPARTNASRT